MLSCTVDAHGDTRKGTAFQVFGYPPECDGQGILACIDSAGIVTALNDPDKP